MKKYSYVGYSDIGGRKENEDTAACRQFHKNYVAIVADGLGGQGDGKRASELAVRYLLKCGATNRLPGKKDIEDAFRTANEEILRRQENAFHMKTTAVYLCIRKPYAIWAHVGDSRLYHFYNGKLFHHTLDHSIPQLAVSLGEIKREDIPGHPKRGKLLRAMGCEGEEAEVFGPVRLAKGHHAFLLCTDGFWEHFSDQELQRALQNSETAEEWMESLRRWLRERSGADQDNNTAIAVFMEA